MKKNRLNIATIPGDGIGKEVIPEGIKVLEKISKKFKISVITLKTIELRVFKSNKGKWTF